MNELSLIYLNPLSVILPSHSHSLCPTLLIRLFYPPPSRSQCCFIWGCIPNRQCIKIDIFFSLYLSVCLSVYISLCVCLCFCLCLCFSPSLSISLYLCLCLSFLCSTFPVSISLCVFDIYFCLFILYRLFCIYLWFYL